MEHISEDLRPMLTKTDLKKITEILNKRHESSNNVEEVRKQIIEGPSKEVANATKYYLALKKFEEKVIDKMISNNVPLDLKHWEYKDSTGLPTGVHIGPMYQESPEEINNDVWYVNYSTTAESLLNTLGKD